jgi:hypothetical protein
LYGKTPGDQGAVLDKQDLTGTDSGPRLSGPSHLPGELNPHAGILRNAAEFHGCRVNMFDAATSSFAKNESLSTREKMWWDTPRNPAS